MNQQRLNFFALFLLSWLIAVPTDTIAQEPLPEDIFDELDIQPDGEEEPFDESDVQPDGEEEPFDESDVQPDGEEEPFDESDVQPDGEEEPFDKSDVQPDGEEELFDESDVPLDSEEEPFDESDVPLDGEEEPFDESDVPLDGEEEPFDESDVPLDGEEEPFDESDVPLDVEEEPFDESDVPLDGEEEPVDESDVPLDGEEEPVDESDVPLDVEEEPFDESDVQIDGEEEPFDESDNPADLEISIDELSDELDIEYPECEEELLSKHFEDLPIECISLVDEENLENISPEEFDNVKPEQVAILSKTFVEQISTEQFEQIPLESLSGFTSDNLGGLSTEIIDDFNSEHIAALNIEEFQQLQSEDISEFFTNFNENIPLTDIENLVPPGWELDLEQGTLTAPVGEKIRLQEKTFSDEELPPQVTLPPVPNFQAGFGVAGKGTPVLEDVIEGLQEDNWTHLIPLQNEHGIIEVDDTNENNQVKKYVVMPNYDDITQAEPGASTGLKTNEGGFYELTTPGDLEITFVPVPKDPINLSKEIIKSGELWIGNDGDVIMEFENSWEIVIFDPAIELAPNGLETGIYWSENPNEEDNWVVYSDGTAQKIYPTIYSPDTFIQVGQTCDICVGQVESLTYKIDGSLTVSYAGQLYLIEPTREVEIEELADGESVKPSFIFNNDGTLTYTSQFEGYPEENIRKRGQARKVKSKLRLKKPGVDDTCVEIDGKPVCDNN
jgi:hypothetical protein